MTPHEEAVFTRDVCTRVCPILHKTVGDLMTFEKFDRRAALTLVGLQLALLIEAAQVSLLAKKTTGAVATQKRFKQTASDIFGDVVRAPPIFNASSSPHC
jgi:hypothetical protein